MFARRRIATVSALGLAAAVTVVAVPSTAQAAPAADPVIIVAGTFSPKIANSPLAHRLRSDGYTAEIFQIPTLGMQDIDKSAQALDAFADQVRARTGAARVDLVGHSQGGLVARAYVKDFGGAAEVDSLIMLGTPNRGTRVANLAEVLGLGNCLAIVACQEMAAGSAWLDDLNAGDDTIGAVRYTTFRTTLDELVRPVDSATLYDGAVNVKIQSQCPLRLVEHIGLIFDGTVYSGIKQALQGRTDISLRCWAL